MLKRFGVPISTGLHRLAYPQKLESKRRLKPTCSLTPAGCNRGEARSISFKSYEIGFSQKMCLPARAAATIRSACVSVGEQMAYASMAGRR